MAIDARYRKMQETDEEVEYSFGSPALDRRLIIDKASMIWTPMDGREDHEVRAVVRGITRRWNENKVWPNGGGVQH